ncbi:MAG: response regulator, partial [Lachnospiraceae bacterium]|nr:response regulator [Lachnospiraceae bacterium]
MKTIVIDDRQHAVNSMLRILGNIDPGGEHDGTIDPDEGIRLLKEKGKEIAFLDIEMPAKNGLLLAKEMKDIAPSLNIIFVTGHYDYAIDALRLRCSDYLIKPTDEEEVIDALENLRYPIKREEGKRIRIQCFGKFEVFVDERPVSFQRTRSLEVFAYIVDRKGARVPLRELQVVMWDDDEMMGSHHSQLRMFIGDIRRAFEGMDCPVPILRGRGHVALDTQMVDCDYYRFLEGDPAAVNLYQGEYMNQYSWA